MKYSEAIRLGSMLAPQCFGHLVDEVGVCANGAAALALGISREAMKFESRWVSAPFEILEVAPEGTAKCPVCSIPERGCSALVICSHLNDIHAWTREQIADWLEQSGHDFEVNLPRTEAPEAESAHVR